MQQLPPTFPTLDYFSYLGNVFSPTTPTSTPERQNIFSLSNRPHDTWNTNVIKIGRQGRNPQENGERSQDSGISWWGRGRDWEDICWELQECSVLWVGCWLPGCAHFVNIYWVTRLICALFCSLCDTSVNTSMYIPRKGTAFQCMDFLVQISTDLLTSSMVPGKLLNCVNSVSSLVQRA